DLGDLPVAEHDADAGVAVLDLEGEALVRKLVGDDLDGVLRPGADGRRGRGDVGGAVDSLEHVTVHRLDEGELVGDAELGLQNLDGVATPRPDLLGRALDGLGEAVLADVASRLEGDAERGGLVSGECGAEWR